MKKIAALGLIAVAASLWLVQPSEANGRRGHFRPVFHSRVVIGVGPAFYYGYPYPYYYYPPPPVVYAPPPVVVQESPPVYVQQNPAPPPAPAAPPPPSASAPAPSGEIFWYYCQSANGYYPTVPSCPEAWIKVPPRP